MTSDHIDVIAKEIGLSRPVSSERLDGGISDVYRLRDTGGQEVILKCYRPEWEWKLLKELFVYRLLEDVAVPTPSILHADATHSVVPVAFLVLERLPGGPLRALGDQVHPDQQERLWHQAGGLLAQINSVPLDQFGYIVSGVIDGHQTNREYMAFQIDKKLTELEAASDDRGLTEQIRAVFASHGYALDVATQARLCHDDLHDGNLLVLLREESWDVTGIVDVENAVAGDPLLDVAKTIEYCLHDQDANRVAFLAGYGHLGDHSEVRLWLYRIYHLVEIYAWFAHIGETAPLAGVEANLRRRVLDEPAPRT